MIEFQAVTKRHLDGTVAVDDLNLVVERGSITVFVGPNGSGKTTSLRMVNRMIEPTSGRILLDGKDVRETPPTLLRRGIGYVIQHAGLFPHRTVLDNVTTVPLLNGTSRRQAEARAGELLDLVGLPAGLAGRYPAELSEGQQQRVGVARALAADPPVLLMDEPFSSVDPIVRADLHQQLLSLQSELGKTIVFVTHDIDEAIKLGDRVAVFRVGGVLAQYDSPSVLLTSPADDFVSTFVGRDRGYRALGLVGAEGIELVPIACVAATELASAARSELDGGWAVVVDERRHPLGWVSDQLLAAGAEQPISRLDLIAGGTLFQVGSAHNLRTALDAALSSPSRIGVAVDSDGAVVAGIRVDMVLAAARKASA